MNDRLRLGEWGEKRAAQYLESKGLEVLIHSYRCRVGEIDLVCRQGDTLVLVEVRTRHRSSWVSPLDTIGSSKQRKLTLAARHLVSRRVQFQSMSMRFDVVAITCDGDTHEIEWVVSAFP